VRETHIGRERGGGGEGERESGRERGRGGRERREGSGRVVVFVEARERVTASLFAVSVTLCSQESQDPARDSRIS
jgi:hypothetical protein